MTLLQNCLRTVSKQTAMISGKSLLNERLTISATLMDTFREWSGLEDSAAIETKLIGTEVFSLEVRILPMLLIMATVVSGFIISASLVEEREYKTLNAVLVTPITPLEVIVAKSFYGLFLGLVLGVVILVLNGSFTGEVHLIILFLILGTFFTVGIGLAGGVIMNNITDLIARMKLFNLFLLFPALVIFFPQIPQWIGKLFPLYYFSTSESTFN
jgi:ABC-2 type transport system permease protein